MAVSSIELASFEGDLDASRENLQSFVSAPEKFYWGQGLYDYCFKMAGELIEDGEENSSISELSEKELCRLTGNYDKLKKTRKPFKITTNFLKDVKVECRYNPLKQNKETMKKSKDKTGVHGCTKCNLEFKLSEDFRNRGWIRHAMKHTPVDQFRCHMCSFHCRQEKEMREHLKITHELTNRSLPFEVTNFEYSKAEVALVDAKGRECFPDWALVAPPTTNLDFLKKKAQNRRSVDKTEFCKECGDGVEANSRTMYESKENHIAACHTEQHIWKCGLCNFTSHIQSTVIDHVDEEHEIEEIKPNVHIKRTATHSERKEMAEMVVAFFPGTKVPGIIMNST